MSNPTSVAVRAGSTRPALRFLLLVLALFGAVGAPSGALASGSATDQEAPKLYAGEASPMWAFATQQVTATFRITDNESGAALPAVTATANSAPFTSVAATVKRISGDGKDSLYTATITVPAGAVGGGWTFATNQLVDHVGNVANGNFTIASFFVIGLGFDTTPPKLVSWTIAPAGSIDLKGAAGTVTVSLKVTDDYTGVRAPVVRAVSAGGAEIKVTASLTAGTKNDGTWTAKLVFPAGAELGAWSISVLALSDEWGNVASSGSSLGSFTVSNSGTGSGGGGTNGGGTNGGGSAGGGAGSGAGGGAGGGGASTTTTTTTTTSGGQGGVLGTRVSSKSYLTFAGSAKGLKFSKKGSVAFSLKCNGTAACKGSVRLYITKKGKRYKIVSRRVSVAGGKTVKLTFTLTKVGKREVKRGKAIKPSISIWTDGIKTPRTKKVTLSTKTLAIKKA